MTGDPDMPEDPYLKALLSIAGELSLIRQELHRVNAPDTSASRERNYHCRLCGDTPCGTEAAKHHAVADHGAPLSDWETTYRDLQNPQTQ